MTGLNENVVVAILGAVYLVVFACGILLGIHYG